MSGPMRVIVVGAGQMGSIYAAAAIENGHEVKLVDANDDLVDHINREGLSITRRDGRVDTYRMPATAALVTRESADLVAVIVKGWATPAAAERVRAGIGPASIVLTIQNGLGNEETLRRAFPDNPLLLGISVHTVVAKGMGTYEHTGVRDTFIGPAGPGTGDAITRAADVFARSDFPVVVLSEAEIRREQWAKFVVNCALLPPLSLTRLPTSAATDIADLEGLMEALARETCGIARAAGIDLDPEERVAFQRELVRTAGGRASMLGDVLASRRTEISSINGAAVAYAEQHGVQAPLNRAMVALIRGLERSFELEA